jgi:proton glutamate symport protein
MLGRVTGKALLLFQVTATLALAFGMAAAVLARPGEGLSLGSSAAALPSAASLRELALSPFSPSIFDSLARGDVLQIVVFAMLFGYACSAAGPAAEPVVRFFEALSGVMFRYTDLVMYAAPFGVFGAMAGAIGTQGLAVLLSLGKLVAVLYVTLAAFLLAVLVPMVWLARVPLLSFLAAVRDPFLIAFSTTSSNVGLPVALERLPAVGVPRHISALVLPLSMSFNTTGSNLFIGLAALFCAQAAGITLDAAQVGMLFLTLTLTTKGIGAVPRGSLVVLAGALTQLGLPLEGVAVILGVDQLMDMARTGVNMAGHCASAALVARWENNNAATPEG